MSLLRLRTRRARAPWGSRLLALALMLSLVFALTPCCEVVGAAVAGAQAAAGHGPMDRDHAGGHAPDGNSPCATWLDRTDAVPPQPDEAKLFPAMHVTGAPPAFRADVVVSERVGPLPRFPVSPAIRLYLHHARLIL